VVMAEEGDEAVAFPLRGAGRGAMLLLLLLLLLGEGCSLSTQKTVGELQLGRERVSQTVLCIKGNGHRESGCPVFFPHAWGKSPTRDPSRVLHDITPHLYKMLS
jgi:hypothetical protein